MNNPPPTAAHAKHTSPHGSAPTTKLGPHKHTFLYDHIFAVLHYFHAFARAHTHTITRQPSLPWHMSAFVEATLTACLTATSVCYEHGPVFPPPFLPLAISSLYLSLTSVLPPSHCFILTGLATPSIPHVELSII